MVFRRPPGLCHLCRPDLDFTSYYVSAWEGNRHHPHQSNEG